jgi:death-on-curing protein
MHIDEKTLLNIHDYMIEAFGGLPGMPDAGRASAIIARVQQTEYYTTPRPDLFQVAALYWASIARGHIFNDANKRTAVATALFFLRRNGINLRAGALDAATEIAVAAATGEANIQRLADYLRSLAVSEQ